MNNQEEFVVDQYTKELKSTYEIAQELNTYPNKIRRILIKRGVELRDKGKAQSVAIQSGRHSHPTKGKKRSEADKIKISESMAYHWETIGEKERQGRVEKAQKQWRSMSEQDRRNLLRAASEGMRKAGREGSKLEKFLKRGLTDCGYSVIFHKKGLIPNERLEIDIFISSLKTAIEIDGPSHFYPIWGEEKLQKQTKSDAHKTGLLLNAGFVVIRVKNTSKNVSNKHQRDLLSIVTKELDKIKKSFPPLSKRFIEVEV
jgi:very-short-patch-repair endonuclease